jgi:hypothetical protein
MDWNPKMPSASTNVQEADAFTQTACGYAVPKTRNKKMGTV